MKEFLDGSNPKDIFQAKLNSVKEKSNSANPTKQKTNKETQTLNDTIDQLDLVDIYRTFHPNTMNFTIFSSAHGTFSRIDHILGHKASLGKFKKNRNHSKHLF